MSGRLDFRPCASLAAALITAGVAVGTASAGARPLCRGPPLGASPAPWPASSEAPSALVYDARPLADVARDLDRLGPRAVRADPSTQRLRFSGVLVVAGQEAMAARLSQLLGLRTSCEGGVLMLHRWRAGRN